MKIKCFFEGFKNANQAVRELKSTGFSNAYVDINDHYVTGNVTTNMAGTQSAPNLSGLVLGSERNDDPNPLLAASPMASGMGGFEEIADVNCCVIVETSEADAEKAIQVLKSLGGELDNPNFKIPKGLENVSIDDIISNMEI
ncbi:hypothetical protein [Clostridium cylindrosporum]|uniref:Heat induced stress protein YflT n=1 Tax=Clostridium cylindrosporum DSM 605 TaxID=1121307 RepID=A0A0J8G2F7_CLOCY|nr:hypothetical protein [Clostridium cylindrosporum]KMT21916.1 hypothetical protein CLCY_3c01870 [Clostridium cylindrosporum DSM 605]